MLLTEQKLERHCLHALTSWAPAYPDTGLINVFSGCVIDDLTVNVHEAVEVGAADQQAFNGGWPVSFHIKLKKKVKNKAAVMVVTAKHAKADTAIDTEFIYARVIGIMATSRESVSIETMFSHELTLQSRAFLK